MPKSSREIRQEFIDFFAGKEHAFVRSAPVVPQDDPTLMFTNAGMNQFKPIFLGDNKRGLKRAVNSQKCMRVSGKHNDLEEVGRDHYHHTLFEMLGNWSFGDYYKREAITWAWELLTKVWKLDKQRLYVTVYEEDEDAVEIWKSATDIDAKRILRFGKKDNFWEMGDTGPCGPCSEIHYDIGDPATREETFADPVLGVNGENDRYREIWNLVFIQFNRKSESQLEELPSKHVDTGMGFERVVAVLQNSSSNYGTDLFMPIITKLGEMCNVKYDKGESGTPFRVIADHIRALVVTITDGVFPSNEGRGYVLRRLLRRAYRFGRSLEFDEPFLHKLVDTVIEIMGGAFPEIRERRDYVIEVIKSEEERFDQTLEQGIEIFNGIARKSKSAGNEKIDGSDVFALYDTYGFPMDLTRLMAQEQQLDIDEDGFYARMDEQKQRARLGARKSTESSPGSNEWIDVSGAESTEFIGFESGSAEVKVARFRKLEDEALYQIVLEKTPFYAEAGGQVGDRGVLTAADGVTIEVLDTFKVHDTIVHKAKASRPLDTASLATPLKAEIITGERQATMRNHSATHLLQAALRSTLGDHVQQSGSRVDPLSLRFDFTHFKALTPQEIEDIELQVNEWILLDLAVTWDVKPIEQARSEGAMALFGEKYADEVRVVSMGDISKEFCGGTHVRTTGNIGMFHITSESSISAGIRRIEAITGLNSLGYLQRKERTLLELVRQLKTAEEKLPEKVTGLLDTLKHLQTETAQLQKEKAGGLVQELIDAATAKTGPILWTVKNLGECDKNEFGDVTNALSDALRERQLTKHLFVLGATSSGKALFAACASKQLTKAAGVHCGNIVKAAAQAAGGNGGGSPYRAQAGGKDAGKVQEALDIVESIVGDLAS
ncbi:MAG: alanine--tRNA ligase [Chitinivibrionales bacterium]|nr:alanine--tRNA ligase [Chitinivibrionales bacterium]